MLTPPSMFTHFIELVLSQIRKNLIKKPDMFRVGRHHACSQRCYISLQMLAHLIIGFTDEILKTNLNSIGHFWTYMLSKFIELTTFTFTQNSEYSAELESNLLPSQSLFCQFTNKYLRNHQNTYPGRCLKNTRKY